MKRRTLVLRREALTDFELREVVAGDHTRLCQTQPSCVEDQLSCYWYQCALRHTYLDCLIKD